MARPAIRALRRRLIEQHGSISIIGCQTYTNTGHVWHVIDQTIAYRRCTTKFSRELHSASQEHENQAGPSTSKRNTVHNKIQSHSKYRSRNEAQLILLRREAGHPNPRPSIVAKLLRNVLECEQIWPLKSDGLRAREVIEVLELLKDRQMKEGRWQRLDFLQHVESIHDSIRNCYHKVRQKIKTKIGRDFLSNKLSLTEEEVENQIVSQIDIGNWQSLLKSSALRDLLSSCRQIPLRIPSLADIREVFEAIANDPSVPDRKSKYEKLLQDINRALPPYKRLESPTSTQILDETKMEEIAIDWNAINLEREGQQKGTSRTFSGIVKTFKDRELLKPLGSIKMFEEVWKVMQCHMIPTSSSFSSALDIEIKLATWRSAKLHKRIQIGQSEFDQEGEHALDLVWKPVTDLIQNLHTQGKLQTKIVNQVMWNTVRHDPNHSFPNLSSQDNEHFETSSAKFVWPKLESVSAVYEIMRNILLQRERGLAAPQSGVHQQRRKIKQLPAKLLGSVLLNDGHIPTAWTYNLMLRFYSSRGDLKSVLQIVQDMDNTLIGRDSEYPKISMVTFGYIFDAFAKHGVPSRLVRFDREAPEKSIWTVEDGVGKYEEYDWNMNNLRMFYERFLQMQPDEASQFSQNSNDLKPSWYERERLFYHPQDPLDQATLIIREKMTDVARTSALAPSSQQQFFIITALRRVSGDEAEWVISQYVRLAAKFGTFSESIKDANGSPINDEGWKGFRMRRRIERIMEMLYKSRDSEDVQQKEVEWSIKFGQEVNARLFGIQDDRD